VVAGSEHVVAISQAVAISFAGRDWERVGLTVVHNAVDLDRFDPVTVPRDTCRAELIPQGGLVLSVIAQITPWKGQDLAVEVLAELRKRGVDAVLLIVGEAKFVGARTRHDNRAYERELRELVARLDLHDHVRFLGERSDPHRCLAATDVLLVSSTEEPFGRTIIEAMAMGVPVVATSVGGPPELLGDGIGGCTVDGREPTSWADAAMAMTARPTECRAAARAAAEQRFSRARHTEAILGTYCGTLAAGPSPCGFRTRSDTSPN
jgi:glycosyltransferase involved in cell wall biosynthesis